MFLINEKGEEPLLNFVKSNWKPGCYLFNDKSNTDSKIGYQVVKINKIIPKTIKQLDEARGIITSDYQNHLEKLWLESLKKNHSVSINKEVLSTIK
jgi:peptidyl-prolyl cis-trans isomerase SurA